MKKVLMIMVVALVLLSGCSSSGQKENSKKKIGVLIWVEHPALNDALIGLEAGLEDLGVKDEIEIVVKNANDDASNANMMVDQFVNDGVDLIYAIATPAAQAAMAGTDSENIPVVFNAVTDAESAGLVDSNDKPAGHVTGVSDMVPVNQQLALIKEFLPNAQKIGVLYNTGEDNSLHQIKLIESMISKHGLDLVTQGIGGTEDIALATETLVSKVDALYIITDNTVASATSQVVGIANETKTPVFMAEAGQFEHGILASDSISYVKLGEAAAKQVKDILFEDVKPGDIPVVIGGVTELLVSESVAEFLELEIPESVLERATLK